MHRKFSSMRQVCAALSLSVFYPLVSTTFLTFCFVVLLTLPSALISSVLLVLTWDPWLLKLFQTLFQLLVNKHSQDSLVSSTLGLLTGSLSTLYPWPQGGCWPLYIIWVRPSYIISDLCIWPNPCHLELFQLSSCLYILLYFGFQFHCMSWILTLPLIDSYLFIRLISLRLLLLKTTLLCLRELLSVGEGSIEMWDLRLLVKASEEVSHNHQFLYLTS